MNVFPRAPADAAHGRKAEPDTAAAQGGVPVAQVDVGAVNAEPRAARLANDRRRVAAMLDGRADRAAKGFRRALAAYGAEVVLTDGADADPDAFFRTAERLGAAFPNPPRVFPDLSRDGGLAAFREQVEVEPIPVVLGSSVQKAALGAGQAAVVELGYPSVFKHALYPTPWMGYNGALALVQRLVDARNHAF